MAMLFQNSGWESLAPPPQPGLCKFSNRLTQRQTNFWHPTFALVLKLLKKMPLRISKCWLVISKSNLAPIPCVTPFMAAVACKTKKQKATCSSRHKTQPQPSSQTALARSSSLTYSRQARLARLSTRSLRKASRSQRCSCSTWTLQLPRSSLKSTEAFSPSSSQWLITWPPDPA